MRQAVMSVLGLYNWDNTIFDNMVLPNGIPFDDTRDSILAECAEMDCSYTEPEILKNLIGIWARKNYRAWEKLYYTTIVEYNPIENYDRKEEWEEDNTLDKLGQSGTQSNASSTLEQVSGSETSGNHSNTMTNSGSDTVTHAETAFNSGSFMDNKKDTTTLGSSQADTGSEGEKVNNAGKSSGTSATTNYGTSKELETGKMVRKGRAHGNIGVTTTQQMLESEREIAQFNVIDFIIRSFKHEFCILMY